MLSYESGGNREEEVQQKPTAKNKKTTVIIKSNQRQDERQLVSAGESLPTTRDCQFDQSQTQMIHSNTSGRDDNNSLVAAMTDLGHTKTELRPVYQTIIGSIKNEEHGVGGEDGKQVSARIKADLMRVQTLLLDDYTPDFAANIATSMILPSGEQLQTSNPRDGIVIDAYVAEEEQDNDNSNSLKKERHGRKQLA